MSGFSPIKLAYSLTEPDNLERLKTSIILVHGAGASKESWYKVTKTLASEMGSKVYAIDLRNHGDSPWSDDFDIPIMANDIENFMEEQKIGPAIFIGHSLGGVVCMYIALSKPNLVTALIVEDSTFKSISEDSAKRFAMLINVMKKSITAVPADVDLTTARNIIQEILYSNTPKEFATAEERRDATPTQIVKENDGYKWKANLDAILKFCSNKDLINSHQQYILDATYSSRTLFIYGTRSILNIMNDKEYHLTLFPRAEFEAIEDATHLVHNEYPKEFCDSIVKFLESF